MLQRAGLGDRVPSVPPVLGQAHRGQPLQAGAVLRSGRSTDSAAQHQPVERRAAAGFQIGLVPHAGYRQVPVPPWQVRRIGIGKDQQHAHRRWRRKPTWACHRANAAATAMPEAMTMPWAMTMPVAMTMIGWPRLCRAALPFRVPGWHPACWKLARNARRDSIRNTPAPEWTGQACAADGNSWDTAARPRHRSRCQRRVPDCAKGHRRGTAWTGMHRRRWRSARC